MGVGGRDWAGRARATLGSSLLQVSMDHYRMLKSPSSRFISVAI